jgi:hypothetical protein
VRGGTRFTHSDEHRFYILRQRNRRRDNTDTSSAVVNHVTDTRLEADLDIGVVPCYRPTDVIRGAGDFEISLDTGALDSNDKGAVGDRVLPEPRTAAFPSVQ